jgi:murein DD-endopeptidase MepM/ murein hydrolase activator NlpD
MLLLVTAWLNGFFTRHKLPFLSFPFLITYWIVYVAASNLTYIHPDETHIYSINEIARIQSTLIYQIAHIADKINVHPFVLIYFKTLAGTFFQNSILAGILIAIGLLYFSRIAFSLSLIGFAGAYYCYSLFGADVNDLNYHLLGSNFIFLAIGVGCFYLIPNIYSYITVILLLPVLMLVLIFLAKILVVFHLKAYTLSFSVLCTAFLFSLNQRWLQKYLHTVSIQYFSAEKTIYKYRNSTERFRNAHLAKIGLPFWGEWMVSQGYNGKITHLGDWGKALDFVILDAQFKTYKEPGIVKEDFYCFNKPILAPLDGYIYNIINTVDDNDIADVNTEQNWGNTIVMNHLNGLFSAVSHIKRDSFKVSIGEYVTKGTVVALCGNSGRSPEPHIHFQLQTSPEVGAKTLEYPISYFIEKNNDRQQLMIASIPREGTFITNVQLATILIESFSFIPGRKIVFQNVETENLVTWEIFTDAWNRSYFYCHESKSVAYFVNDGTMFYFTDFEGDKNSLLFNFYLAAYRQLLGYYDDITVEDQIPLIHFNSKWIQWLQDFLAPFYLFTKTSYQSDFISADSILNPKHLKVQALVEAKFINYTFKKINFEFTLAENKILEFIINTKNKKEQYRCVG